MARTSIYPKNCFEHLLWWAVLTALSWGFFIALFWGIKWLWCFCCG